MPSNGNGVENMPRDGSGVYSKPSGTTAVSGATVASSPYNTFCDDLVTDANAARPITAGGTDATDAATALSNLGGQASDADLTAIAALGFSSTSLLRKTAANTWALTTIASNVETFLGAADYAAMRTQLGLVIGTNVQAYDADLTTWAGLTPSAFFQTLVDDADAATARTTLGLGTAAVKNTGTSGNNVPLLDGANTWSAAQVLQGNLIISKAIPNLTLVGTSTNIIAIELQNASRYDDIRNTTSGFSFRYDTSGTPKEMLWNGTSLTLNAVAVPTISSSDTLSNKTLSSPTLSGTVAGAASWSSQQTFSAGIKLQSDSDGILHYEGGGTLRWINGIRSDLFGNDQDWGLWSNSVGTTLIAKLTTGELIGISTGPTSVYSLGYRGAPLGNGGSAANSAYGFVLADAGCTIYHDEVTARTYTIPANSSVAYPIGTVIIIDNTGNSGSAGSITLAITTDTLRRGDGVSGTGSRTIAANCVAAIRKTKSTEWSITGTFT